MKPSAPRPDLLLHLAVSTEHGIAEIVGEICYLNTRDNPHRKPWHDDEAVLRPLFEQADGPYDRYADLRVRARIDTGGISNGDSYGWAYEYHRPLSVDLARAQSMTDMLRRLDRQLTALQQRIGAPRDFGEYVTQFACALGITRFAEHSRQMRPDGTHWKWMDVDQMRAWIQRHSMPGAATSGGEPR